MDEYRRRIEALTEAQQAALAQRLDVHVPDGGTAALVAYVVPEGDGFSEPRLREHLRARLPGAMVPSVFVVLDELPRTSTGKLDRNALPDPERSRAPRASSSPSVTAAEQELTRIWADVLGVDDVRSDDDFFELGGDSLLSIRLIARARQAGYEVDPQRFADDPTVRGMAAAAAATGANAQQAPEGPGTGPFALTPIQRWFFEQDFPERHHWNQSLLLAVPAEIGAEAFEQALVALANRHDALRLRFTESAEGWQQESASLGSEPLLRVTELSSLDSALCGAAIERAATERHASMDLGAGRLLLAELFIMPTGGLNRLLLVVHHLAIDAVSWGVLVEELYAASGCGDRSLGALPKAASFQEWADRLATYGESSEIRGEVGHWLAFEHPAEQSLPVDLDAGRELNDVRSAQFLTASLGVDDTRALVHELPPVYKTQINEVLLTALATTLADWSGRREVRVDVEGHGREQHVASLDAFGANFSGTVGWFTTVFPVRLTPAPAASPSDTIKAVKEQLRRIPHGGIGYGVLRYLSDDAALRSRLAAIPPADLVFNYLGRQLVADHGSFEVLDEPTGEARSSRGTRPYLIELNCGIRSDSLEATWHFSPNAHRRETIARLAERFFGALQQLIEHCRAPEAGGATPSDFPLAGLDQAQLDGLASLLDDED